MTDRITGPAYSSLRRHAESLRCQCHWPMAEKYKIGPRFRCQRCGLEIFPKVLRLTPSEFARSLVGRADHEA